MKDRLKIDMQPRKLRIESEPYVVYVGRAYVPVIDVYDIKAKKEYYVIISAHSFSTKLKAWQDENDGKLIHIEFWANKESDKKFSGYELELA